MRACPGICGPHDDHIVNIVFMPKHREIASRVIWGKTRSTNTCLPSPSPSLRFLAYLGRLQRRVTVLVRPKHIYFSFFCRRHYHCGVSFIPTRLRGPLGRPDPSRCRDSPLLLLLLDKTYIHTMHHHSTLHISSSTSFYPQISPPPKPIPFPLLPHSTPKSPPLSVPPSLPSPSSPISHDHASGRRPPTRTPRDL